MKRIKFFNQDSLEDLETAINAFFEQNPEIDFLDLKIRGIATGEAFLVYDIPEISGDADQDSLEYSREDIIATIEGLYPPDHNESGVDLLIRSLCQHWRKLDLDVLETLCRLNEDLCIEREGSIMRGRDNR